MSIHEPRGHLAYADDDAVLLYKLYPNTTRNHRQQTQKGAMQFGIYVAADMDSQSGIVEHH